MCGICGIVSGQDDRIGSRTIERMREVLRHRGPDDDGLYIAHGARTSMGFGFRRLSIIDLSSAGHQPMCNEDGSIWLVYNGEIYNHAEIRSELLARGHQYRSRADSETILHAYEEWGDNCVERFRGMFAFAIWDQAGERLLLARDRLGVKPLYYATLGNTLIFGSEIKAILASGRIPARVAAGAVSEYLSFGYLAGEPTMFAGVQKLLPGHVLVWENGAARISQYWDIRFVPDDRASEADLCDRLLALLEESVRLRLMSDVPLGVFLSGGLDSSAIAAIMSRQVAGRVKTFSVGYDSAAHSELPFARVVARHIGSDHHEVTLTADAFLKTLPALVWHEDEPIWGPPSVALYHVAALAADTVTVVLTGEGSDELFAGYDRYWMNRWNAMLLRGYGGLPQIVRSGVRGALQQPLLPERLRRALGHTFLNHDTWPDGLVLDNWFGVFTPKMQREIGTDGLRAELARIDVYEAHRRIFDRADATNPVDRMLYMDIKTNLLELLMKQDQMSMASSIESRVPFLDHELVEFAATVPVRYKIGWRSGKHLLKQALGTYLPDSIINRPKKGFPVPFDSWLREHFLGHVRTVLLDRTALNRGWFEPAAVRQLLDRYSTGANLTRQLWNLWVLELWARIFLDGWRDWEMLDAARTGRVEEMPAAQVS